MMGECVCVSCRVTSLCSLQVMEFYCQSCETAMCRECTEGEHAEHPTVPLKDVVEQHKASLQVQLDAVNKRCHVPPDSPSHVRPGLTSSVSEMVGPCEPVCIAMSYVLLDCVIPEFPPEPRTGIFLRAGGILLCLWRCLGSLLSLSPAPWC